MNVPASIAVTPVFVADLLVEGDRMPIYVHVIDHPDARVLVDTAMTQLLAALTATEPCDRTSVLTMRRQRSWAKTGGGVIH